MPIFFTKIYKYLSNPPHEQDTIQGHFKAEFNRYEFRVFLLVDLLPYQV